MCCFSKSKVRPSVMGTANGKQGIVTPYRAGAKNQNCIKTLIYKKLRPFFLFQNVTREHGKSTEAGERAAGASGVFLERCRPDESSNYTFGNRKRWPHPQPLPQMGGGLHRALSVDFNSESQSIPTGGNFYSIRGQAPLPSGGGVGGRADA
jgi:hypothetical protein